jgi:hypothetical protein
MIFPNQKISFNERPVAMFTKWQAIVVVSIILIALSACSSGGTNGNTPSLPLQETALLQEQPAIGSNGFKVGDAAKWPDYIPSDIPPLVSHIRLLMEAPGVPFIRIEYDAFSQDQLKQYLALLEQKGFKLDYIVYTQPSMSDEVIQKRIKQGNYDAVDVSKDKYHMRIEYRGNEATFDIDTTGFEDAVSAAITAAAPHWPSDLEGLVPQPDRCSLLSISPHPSQPKGYNITCQLGDETAGENYIQTLETAGFVPQEIKKSDGNIQNATFIKEKIEIFLGLEFTSKMDIIVSMITTPKYDWPSELMGIVPPPEKCQITDIDSIGGKNFSIFCKKEDEQTAPGYINRLISDGFVESNRMTTQSGDVISVDFDKGNLRVQLLIGSLADENMSISVSEKPQ